MDALNLSEQQILDVPATRPERLFPGELSATKQLVRRLRSKWHPDTNPGTNPKVLERINELYDLAVELITSGKWPGPSAVTITGVDGREFKLSYLKSVPFELGTAYLGQRVLAYHIRSDYGDLVRVAEDQISRFTYADVALRNEHERHLPKLKAVVEVSDGYFLVIEKSEKYLRLADVLAHSGGKIDPRHVAWIISTMLNLHCYLGLIGTVHHHISPETYFINPVDHDGALLGGWWYSISHGERLIALPTRTLNLGPTVIAADKRAMFRTSAELIRATARDLLGDSGGSRLASMGYPLALIDWARGAAGADPFEEYSHWSTDVLPKSFGARRFVEMNLTAADVYGR